MGTNELHRFRREARRGATFLEPVPQGTRRKLVAQIEVELDPETGDIIARPPPGWAWQFASDGLGFPMHGLVKRS